MILDESVGSDHRAVDLEAAPRGTDSGRPWARRDQIEDPLASVPVLALREVTSSEPMLD